jgi:spore coat protein E
MEEIKKIVAKAAFGQGTKSFSKDVHINTNESKKPTEILGITVTDAKITSCAFAGNMNKEKVVRIQGTFDVHLWYALNSDTKVTKVGVKFSDIVMVSGPEADNYHNEEARAWIQRTPTCSGTSIVDGPEGPGVTAIIEYELGAEIVGLTTLNVKVVYTPDVLEEIEDIPMENVEIPDEYEDD